MQHVDRKIFHQWLEKHFDDIDIAGDEFKVNSIFTEDRKHHLWCNPSKNAFHCWKTGRSGNLSHLVVCVTGCSLAEAQKTLKVYKDDFNYLQSRLISYFNKSEPPQKEILVQLPPNTFPVVSLAKELKHLPEKYLKKRGLDTGFLLYCISGKYQQRIILPYYNQEGDLIYWNGRDITGKSSLRYWGPDKECGIGKGDVVYVPYWNKVKTKIYLTEGEFDALTLDICGFPAGAIGGKEMTEKQMDFIKDYSICLALDNDKSGLTGLNKIGDKLVKYNRETSYVLPRCPYKDWNEFYLAEGVEAVKNHVKISEEIFTPWTSIKLRALNL